MSERTSRLSNAIPALANASLPPSSLSRILITATTSQEVSCSILSTALIAEPPVVVTSVGIFEKFGFGKILNF